MILLRKHYLTSLLLMTSPRVFVNTIVFMVPAQAFNDAYPGTTYRDATFELSNLGSVVLVYAGQFHVEILGDDNIHGLYMLSRSLGNTQPDRRQFPRIGIPAIPQGSLWARTALPEKYAEFIGFGLICAPKYDSGQSTQDVSVLYRLHLLDSLLLTFAVDFSAIADFNLCVIFRFDSTLHV
jgi:hypothetical protein